MTPTFRLQIQAVRGGGITSDVSSTFERQRTIGGDKSLGYNRIVEEEVLVRYA